jgi:antitoxin MazE
MLHRFVIFLLILKKNKILRQCNYNVSTHCSTIMNVPLIAIGNSKGIRLHKTILEQYNIQESIELTLYEDHIVLKPAPLAAKPRQDWDTAFKRMHKNGDDILLIDDVFDDERWM